MELLWQYVEKWAKDRPDAEAMVFGDERITWRAFDELVNKTAAAFLELGIQRGDRIAMVSMGRPEFLITFMAASKVGAMWLGLSPKFTLDELRYILTHSQPKLLITLRSYMGVDLVQTGLTLAHECLSIENVLVIGERPEGADEAHDFAEFIGRERPEFFAQLAARAAEVSPDDDVLLMYTSGSTGRPKGVIHSHRNILRNIEVETLYFGFDTDGRVLLHFPINHVAADVEIGFGAIHAGAALILMDHFDPTTSLEMIERERVTVVGQVPVMFLMQFQSPKFATMDWSHVRAFVWGGSGAPQLMLHVLRQIAQKTGARLITGYGSTELCGFATYTMADDDLELLTKSAGKIVPPFEMKIVNAAHEELPHGEVGEIAIRGPIIMKGYLNNPAATAESIDSDGWLYTRDLGWMNADGYLFISGRQSEMFKTGGENVFPREVEDVLEGHPAVLFAAVIGVPDELYAEVGHAFIMMKPGQTTTEDTLRAFCKERLANFKVPKRFDLRPMLPLLPNGKVNKQALKAEIGL